MNAHLRTLFHRINATLGKAATKDDLFRIGVLTIWILVAIMSWVLAIAVACLAP